MICLSVTTRISRTLAKKTPIAEVAQPKISVPRTEQVGLPHRKKCAAHVSAENQPDQGGQDAGHYEGGRDHLVHRNSGETRRDAVLPDRAQGPPINRISQNVFRRGDQANADEGISVPRSRRAARILSAWLTANPWIERLLRSVAVVSTYPLASSAMTAGILALITKAGLTAPTRRARQRATRTPRRGLRPSADREQRHVGAEGDDGGNRQVDVGHDKHLPDADRIQPSQPPQRGATCTNCWS